VLQVDEPALAAVLAGQVPTASGLGRHRVVHPPEASAAMTWLVEAARESAEQTEVWFHSCAPGTPLDLLRGTGASGLSVDLSQVDAAGQNVLAEALEAGETVALGVVATLEPGAPPTDAGLAEVVLRWLDMLGLDPESVSGQLVVTPTCGLAGASAAWARRAMTLARQAAANLSG
jgi:methionine synthase II (cobalamin-independent)